MEHKKLQSEELDVLCSVYGKDLERDSDDTFTIHLCPSLTDDNDSFVKIRIVYGPTYPETPPKSIEIIESVGLPPDSKKKLNTIIQKMVPSIGNSQSIFDLIQSIQDFLHNKVIEIIDVTYNDNAVIEDLDISKDSSNEDDDYESEEQDDLSIDTLEPWIENINEPNQDIQIDIQPNTVFSREQFLKWNENFIEQYTKLTEEVVEMPSSIPGKQLFLQNIVQDTEIDILNHTNPKDTPIDEKNEVYWLDNSLYDTSDTDDDISNDINILSQQDTNVDKQNAQAQKQQHNDNTNKVEKNKTKKKNKDKDKKNKEANKDSKNDTKKVKKTNKHSFIDKVSLDESFTNILG